MTTSYATYTYYTSTFLGVDIEDETTFNRLALRASAVLDRITFNRAADVTDEDDLDALSMACCAIAEEIQVVTLEGGSGGIKSESVGSHSVTYSENNDRMFTNNQRYENAARIYLEGTIGNLMYKGFASGEYGGSVSDENE